MPPLNAYEIEKTFLYMAIRWGQTHITFKKDILEKKRSFELHSLFTNLVIDAKKTPLGLRARFFGSRGKSTNKLWVGVKQSYGFIRNVAPELLPAYGKAGRGVLLGMKLLEKLALSHSEFEKLQSFGERLYLHSKKIRAHLLHRLQGHLKSHYQFKYWPSGGLRSVRQLIPKESAWFARFAKNGNLIEEGVFQHGVRAGMWRWYHPEGRRKSLGFFKKGSKVGLWKEWEKGGQLVRREVYNTHSAKLHGRQRRWYANGKRKSEEIFVNGVRDGESLHFREDGTLAEKKIFKEGALMFHQSVAPKEQKEAKRHWHANGKKKSEVFFKKGKMDGVCRGWHSNGRLAWMKSYREGVKHGEFRVMRKDGTLTRRRFFHYGQPDKEWVRYSANNVLLEKRFYNEGKPLGTWSFFDPVTASFRKESYHQGKKHGMFVKGKRFSTADGVVRHLHFTEEVYSSGKRISLTEYAHKKEHVEVKLSIFVGKGNTIVRVWKTQKPTLSK